MTKIHLKLTIIVVFAVALMLMLSGCGENGYDLEGKNVATFELSGGVLETDTSSVDTQINFAYHPGTYIIDPVKIPGYKLYRDGYNFTGWYTSSDCKPSDKWDFETPFNSEKLTLYAGWEKAIITRYSLCYVYEGQSIEFAYYDVSAGAAFEDWRNFAGSRNGYTPMGYYSDASMTTPWDPNFKHPGGETDSIVSVYVDYIEGTWIVTDTFSELRDALKSGGNIYLTGDIDCGGELLVDLSLTTSYSGIFEGNGHTVSNFKVSKTGGLRPAIAIFDTLGDGSEIRNVSFASVNYDFTGIGDNVSAVKAAALAINALGTKITNVTVSGTLTTNYTKELPSMNLPVYEEDAEVTAEEFTSTITKVEIQN